VRVLFQARLQVGKVLGRARPIPSSGSILPLWPGGWWTWWWPLGFVAFPLPSAVLHPVEDRSLRNNSLQLHKLGKAKCQ